MQESNMNSKRTTKPFKKTKLVLCMGAFGLAKSLDVARHTLV
jgi:hypothetical protein